MHTATLATALLMSSLTLAQASNSSVQWTPPAPMTPTPITASTSTMRSLNQTTSNITSFYTITASRSCPTVCLNASPTSDCNVDPGTITSTWTITSYTTSCNTSPRLSTSYFYTTESCMLPPKSSRHNSTRIHAPRAPRFDPATTLTATLVSTKTVHHPAPTDSTGFGRPGPGRPKIPPGPAPIRDIPPDDSQDQSPGKRQAPDDEQTGFGVAGPGHDGAHSSNIELSAGGDVAHAVIPNMTPSTPGRGYHGSPTAYARPLQPLRYKRDAATASTIRPATSSPTQPPILSTTKKAIPTTLTLINHILRTTTFTPPCPSQMCPPASTSSSSKSTSSDPDKETITAVRYVTHTDIKDCKGTVRPVDVVRKTAVKNLPEAAARRCQGSGGSYVSRVAGGSGSSCVGCASTTTKV